MTLKTYQVLFWVVLSGMIIVLAVYAYLFSRGLVTFSWAGERIQIEQPLDTTQGL